MLCALVDIVIETVLTETCLSPQPDRPTKPDRNQGERAAALYQIEEEKKLSLFRPADPDAAPSLCRVGER